MSAPRPPIVHGLVQSLQAALQTMATSSGYFFDVKATSVVGDAQALDAIPTSETPFIIVGHRVDPLGRDFTGSRPVSVKDRWRITLEAAIDAPASDTAAKEQALSQFESDVEAALTVDPERKDLATWTQNKVLQALYTYVQQGTRFMGLPNQTRVYIEIPVDVLLQRTYGVA